MLRTLRTVCTVNLPLAIIILAGYILYGLASGAPIGEHFFGMLRSRMGRGGGPMVPAWTFYAMFQGLILVLFLCERLFQLERNSDRVFCMIFAIVPDRIPDRTPASPGYLSRRREGLGYTQA